MSVTFSGIFLAAHEGRTASAHKPFQARNTIPKRRRIGDPVVEDIPIRVVVPLVRGAAAQFVPQIHVPNAAGPK
jgi:hypothetical protein